MKNRILYGILVFLLLPNVSGKAQVRVSENFRDGKTLIMLTPQYLMIDQLRIEIDKRIAKQHWITFAPHYVQNHQRLKTHSGFGLAATYKFFFKESSTYIGAGAQFTHHIFNNHAWDISSESELWMFQTKITEYGANAIVGHYIRFFPHLYGDFYAGLGYRLSSTTSSDDIQHAFSNDFFTYGQKGFRVIVGFRIGILL